MWIQSVELFKKRRAPTQLYTLFQLGSFFAQLFLKRYQGPLFHTPAHSKAKCKGQP